MTLRQDVDDVGTDVDVDSTVEVGTDVSIGTKWNPGMETRAAATVGRGSIIVKVEGWSW